MPYKIAYRARYLHTQEDAFCSCVVSLYAEGCKILRSGGTILQISTTDPASEPAITVADLRSAIAAEDHYRREYASVGIDYPSMGPLRAT
ncbi:MAG: hypothetical protein JO058_13485 [Alphaproteobacteria bacterium]|nr:hypothetical protein [Alphaproteobacteria bacterium]